MLPEEALLLWLQIYPFSDLGKLSNAEIKKTLAPLWDDILSTAKGLGGGLPIGACMMNEKMENVLGYGDHGSTYGGNPACCAGALNVINRIDDTLLDGVLEREAYIRRRLEGYTVTGRGLMLGVETAKPVGEVIAACREAGVLVLSAKTKLRLLPPLNIPMENLAEAMDVIVAALK